MAAGQLGNSRSENIARVFIKIILVKKVVNGKLKFLLRREKYERRYEWNILARGIF
jgi:hypothetical protein